MFLSWKCCSLANFVVLSRIQTYDSEENLEYSEANSDKFSGMGKKKKVHQSSIHYQHYH